MLLNQVMAQMASAEASLYIEDVFQITLYTGTSSARSITTGIDLSGDNDGLVWIKARSVRIDNELYDTVRGPTNRLSTNATSAQGVVTTALTSFNADSFSLGSSATVNLNATTYVAWTFKKRGKFFDVVQVSHTNGIATTVPHALGCAPGMVVAKNLGTASDWFTWHRGLTAGNNILLNSSSPQTGANAYISVSGETVAFSTSAPTGTYIFYLWAHDDTSYGVVQCGSFATDASGNASVSLGWEPQYVMLKAATDVQGWIVVDEARGMTVGSNDQQLYPNLTADGGSVATLNPTATGFDATELSASEIFVYLAIRRGPMLVPTNGTKVYNALARTGTSAVTTIGGVGFAPDVLLSKERTTNNGLRYPVLFSRLVGPGRFVATSTSGAEGNDTASVLGFDYTDGIRVGADGSTGFVNYNPSTYIQHFFRRAPGFFDIVCYTGTNVLKTLAHNLKSVPGMMWVKSRNVSGAWTVFHKGMGKGNLIFINTNGAKSENLTAWGNSDPTELIFTVGADGYTNGAGVTYVAYLFGDTAGLCKAFSYTGNGTSQDITIGFVPRFIVIKRTDSTGDWYVYDTVRGIVSGNDPYLLLNSTAVEVTTTDYIDPIATGFNVSGTVLNINAATYIGWACA